jgi:lysyl-tRNA synthetase, class II
MTTEKNEYQDEIQIRLNRLEKLKNQGLNLYPARTSITHTLSEVFENFDNLQKKVTLIKVAGRIRAIRLHGGSCFITLESDQQKLQAYFKKDEVGEKAYALFTDCFDVGDFIQLSGNLFLTKRGEKTLLVKDYQILAKTLMPLPEKWHGLKDVELRYRQRYLDLLANPETKEIFKIRAKTIKFIRDYLIAENFFEVETPILQNVASGAIALPFKTFHNALKQGLYLRIAPEIYLKELVIGGYEKVFEIARCFRNEGIDFAHNPEFTQVEFYWAYKDYQFLMTYMEKFISDLVLSIKNDLQITYDDKTINFQPPYPRLDFRQALLESTGIDLDMFDEKTIVAEAKKKGLKVEKGWGKGKIADELFKMFVRPKLINPTYIINHPIELSPLAKKIFDRPNYVERFQLILGGKIELMNAFSELNNPLEQEERFKFQQKLQKLGDEESMNKDEDFVLALKHGLPPTVGLGLGIDRLVNVLTDTRNIKEVILFPTLKTEK